MLQLYQQFYREVGVRMFSELLSPRLGTFKGFPRNAVFHYLTNDEEMFPDGSKAYFQGYQKRLPLELIYRSDTMVGPARPAPFMPPNYVIPFIARNKLFRYVTKIEETQVDERTLHVINYNPLKFSYRFPDTPLTEYQKWESYQRTLWEHIGIVTKQSQKNHFIVLDPIEDIPSVSMLFNMGTKEGTTLTRVFNTPDKRFVLQLANFIRKEARERSAIRFVSEEALTRVNLLFLLKDGRCSVLNLGYLFSWISGEKNVANLKSLVQRDEPTVIRSFLKYLLVISASVPEEIIEEEQEEPVDDEDLELPEDEDANEFISGFKKTRQKTPPKEIVYEPDQLRAISDVEEEVVSSDVLKSLDEDLQILENKNSRELHQRGIAIKDTEVVEIEQEQKTYTYEEVHAQVFTPLTPQEGLRNKLTKALDDGTLNPATYKKAYQDSEKYAKFLDPYGSETPVTELVTINPADLLIKQENTQLTDHALLLDKSMANSSLKSYTQDYINHHFKNDILKMVGALQKGGVIIQKHDITEEHGVMGGAEFHNLELKPIDGVASSVWFRLPIVDEDGTYKVAGNKYLMRKQRVDLPIRKISSTEVSLNSYYGKAFVSTESKVANSSSEWILKQINKAAFQGSEWIRDVVPGDTFNSYRKSPYIYGLLSTRFKSFKAGDLDLRFDGTKLRTTYPPEIVAMELTFCGWKGEGPNAMQVLVNQENYFYAYDGQMLHGLGDIYQILNLDAQDAPIRFAELALFRKNVPVGVVLGYRLGWTKLLALLRVTPRFVEPGKRLSLAQDEYPIPFKNGSYVFSRKNALATMILAGFMDYAKITKTYDVSDFEHQNVYLNLLASKTLGAIYIREMDMLLDYFVDPITQEILQDMGEPTTFEGLLVRASELLMTYYHPKPQDGAFTRIRGYERMAGSVYKELTQAIRAFRSKNIANRSKIDISPYKVWQSLNEDPTKMMVPDINPIQDLKNDEGVTYVGDGGRSSDGMNKASRAYHIQDVGVISEGTVDSSDVGVNIYTSSDPILKNLRGLKGEKPVQNANRHSSAVLLAPGAMHDDSNRINFINIQSSHVIHARGYHAPYVRTGYESVVIERMNAMFAYCAKEDGVVISYAKRGIVIQYASGRKVGIEIGSQFGRSEGSIYPFEIAAAVKEGQSFKRGDAIAYNTSFFEYDPWNPGKLVMKNSLTAKTVLWETKQTHEDASSISLRLSQKLETRVAYVRSFMVGFEQNLHHVVTPGQTVNPQDILMSIEDEITSNLGSFGESALETLKGLSKQSPRVNYSGIIDRIEVFYHGDKDQMSPTLRKLADQSDAVISDIAKSTNKPKFTGRVTDDYRVEGKPLVLNKAEIRFYITVSTNMGVADKVVFANQMKSVNSEVMDYKLFTEAGEQIDATFGCRSIAARNVMSPYILGTTITLLKKFAQTAVKLFNEQ